MLFSIENNVDLLFKEHSVKNKMEKNLKKKNIVLIIMFCMILAVAVTIIAVIDINSKNEDERKKETESIVPHLEERIDSVEAYAIETKYCNLYYPAKWKEQLAVEIFEGDIYTVKFYGKIEGKGKQPIFDITFNAQEGFDIGHLKVKDDKVSISVVLAELEIGQDWSDDEVETLCVMQEEVNYLISMLEKEKSFMKNK